MAVPENIIQSLLEEAGLKPTAQQVEETTRLYNTLTEQLERTPAGSLENIEPQYIMEKFGWSTRAMLDHYTAAMREEQGDAIKAFDGFKPFGG